MIILMPPRQALFSEHKEILGISKQSKYTRDFSNHIFSGEALYQKGWIRVVQETAGGIVGFTCVRHKVRSPETVLYFIGVTALFQNQGVGKVLLEDLYGNTPHRRIVLNVMLENEPAREFYAKHDFVEEGPAIEGRAVRLSKSW